MEWCIPSQLSHSAAALSHHLLIHQDHGDAVQRAKQIGSTDSSSDHYYISVMELILVANLSFHNDLCSDVTLYS